MFTWPDGRQVDEAARRWARHVGPERGEVRRVGYFGSYAHGDWGVGSDLDVLILVDRIDTPWERRAAAWDATELPVPVELFVYTASEWEQLAAGSGFQHTIAQEIVWIYDREKEARR